MPLDIPCDAYAEVCPAISGRLSFLPVVGKERPGAMEEDGKARSVKMLHVFWQCQLYSKAHVVGTGACSKTVASKDLV